MGDRILSVNGQDIRGATHETAVMALLSKTDEMKLKVQHDPLPKGFQVRVTERNEEDAVENVLAIHPSPHPSVACVTFQRKGGVKRGCAS